LLIAGFLAGVAARQNVAGTVVWSIDDPQMLQYMVICSATAHGLPP
jgi:hypothetical protein